MDDFHRMANIVQQDYPLLISVEDADAMSRAIRAIMEMVPADDQVLVRGHYDAVTTALVHPCCEGPRTNDFI